MSLNKREIFPGLHGLMSNKQSVFIIEDDQSGLIIIDTGYPRFYKKIIDYLKQINYDVQDINHILITHADGDHVSSLAPLQRLSGAKVYATERTAYYLKRRRNPPHWFFPINIIVQVASFLTVANCHIDHYVLDGYTLDLAGGITVLETPGHTDDHVSYWWESKLTLFGGDVFTNIDGLKLSSNKLNYDNGKFNINAKKLIDLEPEVICSGHGRNVWRRDAEMSVMQNIQKSLI